MGDVTDLHFELSSTIRLRLLHSLMSNKLRVSQLSSLLDITNQECSRHLTRLLDAGLVNRYSDGEYSLTPFGEVTLEINRAHEFTSAHRDYFLTHNLNLIPKPLLQRIGSLNNSSFTDDVMQVLYNVQKMVETSEEYIYRITDRYLFNIVEPISNAIELGVEYKLIEEVNVNYTEVYDQHVLRDMIPGAVHIVQDAPVFLAMNEKEVAALGFRLVDGRFDYHCFRSSDPEFHEWCKELFEHYWDTTLGKSEYWEWRRKTSTKPDKQSDHQ